MNSASKTKTPIHQLSDLEDSLLCYFEGRVKDLLHHVSLHRLDIVANTHPIQRCTLRYDFHRAIELLELVMPIFNNSRIFIENVSLIKPTDSHQGVSFLYMDSKGKSHAIDFLSLQDFAEFAHQQMETPFSPEELIVLDTNITSVVKAIQDGNDWDQKSKDYNDLQKIMQIIARKA